MYRFATGTAPGAVLFLTLSVQSVLSSAAEYATEAKPEARTAGSAMPSHVFWGDSHLHTQLSADAGLFGNKLGLDAACHQKHST